MILCANVRVFYSFVSNSVDGWQATSASVKSYANATVAVAAAMIQSSRDKLMLWKCDDDDDDDEATILMNRNGVHRAWNWNRAFYPIKKLQHERESKRASGDQ